MKSGCSRDDKMDDCKQEKEREEMREDKDGRGVVQVI